MRVSREYQGLGQVIHNWVAWPYNLQVGHDEGPDLSMNGPKSVHMINASKPHPRRFSQVHRAHKFPPN